MPDPSDRFGDFGSTEQPSPDRKDAPDFTPTSQASTSDTLAEPSGSGRLHALDMVLLGVAALLVRLPAYFSQKHLTFDDGVFASSVLAMRDGGVPFRDVFSSQGPLFLPLAYLGDLLGLRTLDSPRVLTVISGVVITLVTYWIVTKLADRRSAAFASLVALTSGCLMWVTASLAADGPALAFATIAFALAIAYNRRNSLATAAWMGLAVGATLSTKAIEAPILLPVVLVLVAPIWNSWRSASFRARQLVDPILAGVVAVAVFVLISLPFGFADVWAQSVTYKTTTSGPRTPVANARKIISTMWDRDLVIWLCAAVILACAVWSWNQRRLDRAATGRVSTDGTGSEEVETATDGTTPRLARTKAVSEHVLVVGWMLTSLLWLIFMVTPMWRPHVSALIPPLALLLGLYAPPRRILYVLAVLSLPLLVIQLDGLLVPGDYKGSEAEVVAILKDLPSGAWALSDEPGLVWRAGRRTTDNMVDASMLRVQQGLYTSATLAEEAALPQVCAVVVRSRERFGYFPDLGDRLASEGYQVVMRSMTHSGDDQRVYVKADCSPPS